jgi:thiol-disulfide isomerase/thioredoxin
VIVSALVILLAGQRTDSPSPDVVLDVPGEYQQPGISTNAPLQGAPLQHANLVDLDGVSVSTSDWFTSTGQPMLVNFWFTSCPPCRREMPALQQAFETYGEQVRFIGVNVQDSASAIRTFVDELGVTYEMLRDVNGNLVVANGISAFPTTLFIDSNGRIVKQVAGELTTESIDRSIALLLPNPSD